MNEPNNHNPFTWHPIRVSKVILPLLSMFAPIRIGAMAIWPFVLMRDRRRLPSDRRRLLRHEIIHLKQWQETLIVFFLSLYVLSYVINLFRFSFNFNKAYREVWFEKEAFANEHNEGYLQRRPWFNWIRNRNV